MNAYIGAYIQRAKTLKELAQKDKAKNEVPEAMDGKLQEIDIDDLEKCDSIKTSCALI